MVSVCTAAGNIMDAPSGLSRKSTRAAGNIMDVPSGLSRKNTRAAGDLMDVPSGLSRKNTRADACRRAPDNAVPAAQPDAGSGRNETRALLKRWAAAPDRIVLREHELMELTRQFVDLLQPGTQQFIRYGAAPTDGTLTRVLLREELTERYRTRITELEETLKEEREFCFAVDRALGTLSAAYERLIRLFYRGGDAPEKLARTLLLSRAQLYRRLRAAETAFRQAFEAR